MNQYYKPGRLEGEGRANHSHCQLLAVFAPGIPYARKLHVQDSVPSSGSRAGARESKEGSLKSERAHCREPEGAASPTPILREPRRSEASSRGTEGGASSKGSPPTFQRTKKSN